LWELADCEEGRAGVVTAGGCGALVEAFKIAEEIDTRDSIVCIIRELAESEKGRAVVVAAGALLGAFMIDITRSDGLITSLRLARTILKLSKSKEGRAGLVAAGGCEALVEALRIDERDFEMFFFDCLQDFWELERCIKKCKKLLYKK
jgi:hypothetical protein